jgi:mycothiol S-conjugate amidase
VAGRQVFVPAGAGAVGEVNVAHARMHLGIEVNRVPTGGGGMRGVKAEDGEISQRWIFVTQVRFDLSSKFLDAVHVLDGYVDFSAVSFVELDDGIAEALFEFALPAKWWVDHHGLGPDGEPEVDGLTELDERVPTPDRLTDHQARYVDGSDRYLMFLHEVFYGRGYLTAAFVIDHQLDSVVPVFGGQFEPEVGIGENGRSAEDHAWSHGISILAQKGYLGAAFGNSCEAHFLLREYGDSCSVPCHMAEPLVLMTVHAHPDDESSKGAGTVARYANDGVRSVLVCCTGGEQGDILNPALDADAIKADIAAYRRQELADAVAVIGYDATEMLGYEDSGMAGSEANSNPRCFARADATEAVGRLVTLIRKHCPQVVVTYGDDQELYPHPDHLRVHDVSIAAFDAAADADAYPDSGSPWQVSKMYYSVFPVHKLQRLHQELRAMGEESPFPDSIDDLPHNDNQITTRVDIEHYANVSRDALLAHKTQIDPNSSMWFRVLPKIEAELGFTDDYVLARSLVESDESTGDLFSGLREA